jgi:hypothetical protein
MQKFPMRLEVAVVAAVAARVAVAAGALASGRRRVGGAIAEPAVPRAADLTAR